MLVGPASYPSCDLPSISVFSKNFAYLFLEDFVLESKSE